MATAAQKNSSPPRRRASFWEEVNAPAAPEDFGPGSPPSSLSPLSKHKPNRQRRNGGDDEKEGGSRSKPPLVRGLPDEAKRAAVILFAQYHSVSMVQRALAEEFGHEWDKRSLAKYNPDSHDCRIGKSLKTLFDVTRAAWLRETATIGIAHQTHRLRVLERLIDKAEARQEFDIAGKLLEQAAKEMGGVLTNKKQVSLSGHVEHRHLSAEDARAELAMRLERVIDGGTLTPLPSPEATEATA